mmetsp:Transcript_11964/g.17873  ORF Transcript_11964/g.17873 Transcript_11964/m.17873 type:complete len:111 (+) Transcript_11964:270-602(+)
MLSELKGIHGENVSENAYTALIRSACNAGNTEYAKSALVTMRNSQNAKPKLRSYSPIFSELSKSDKIDEIIDLWNWSKKDEVSLEENQYLDIFNVCIASSATSQYFHFKC